MAARIIDFSVDTSALGKVRAAMAAEADGKKLQADLKLAIKVAAEPMVNDAKASIRSASTMGHSGAGMRDAIANDIRTTVSLSGKTTGVAINVPKGKFPRGFKNAAAQFNRPSWRHPVFGSSVWEPQVGKPGWFDNAMKGHEEEAREAVLECIEAMAERIALRVAE